MRTDPLTSGSWAPRPRGNWTSGAAIAAGSNPRTRRRSDIHGELRRCAGHADQRRGERVPHDPHPAGTPGGDARQRRSAEAGAGDRRHTIPGRHRDGAGPSSGDRASAATPRSAIPGIEAGIVQAEDRLCALLGIPPRDIGRVARPSQADSAGACVRGYRDPRRPAAPTPGHPPCGTPTGRAGARIGIAKADLYPSFSLVGDIRLASEDVGNLFEGDSVQAFGGRRSAGIS